MATSPCKIFCILAAFCIMTKAHNAPNTNFKAKPIQRHIGAPQKQTMFDFPVNQGTGPSAAGPSVGGPSYGASSVSYMAIDSSSSEESDVDMDMESDVDINDADSAVSFVFGRNGNQISGNMRPMFRGSGRQRVMSGDQDAGDHGELLGRTTGSSGQGVGIAFGVLGLLALVVAAAFFTIRKYRHNIPVLVRT